MAKIGYAELGQNVEVLSNKTFTKTIELKKTLYHIVKRLFDLLISSIGLIISTSVSKYNPP